ncbi:MAG: hypothetical protein CSB32_00125 [Desulfobacterales bacterium]|nr:MAG: hypothetical protein CSB32_00125 [Desulfobacterales bacterium]
MRWLRLPLPRARQSLPERKSSSLPVDVLHLNVTLRRPWWKKLVLPAIVVFLVVVTGALAAYLSYITTAYPSVVQASETTVVVTIPKGSSLGQIADILGENQLVRNDIRFRILARLSGLGTRLQAGEFLLPRGKKPREILSLLASAKPVSYAVTIPEGLTAQQIASLFADGGWCSKERFLELVTDPQRIKAFGLSGATSLEGFLFPDTYLLTRDSSGAEVIVQRMLARFTEVWKELTVGLEPPPDVDRTVILASIVEKETAVPQERARIAGVFLNRLEKGMRLQSDPTVIYGIKDYQGRIRKKDLQTPTPYNTYTLPGLPVGPICSPGRQAIDAVLRPAATSSLYFVAKNDGTHHFSESLAAHNRAVQKYQRKKKQKKENGPPAL